MREQTPPTQPTLTLIEGSAKQGEFGLSPALPAAEEWTAATIKPPLTRRPGDRLESWRFDEDALTGLRRAAGARGLCADTAVTLVIERQLVLAELAEAGLGDLEDTLDRRASEAKPQMELWSAHNDYLGYLLRSEKVESDSRSLLGSPRVALPTRLVDRIAHRDLLANRVNDDQELESAVTWEIAALRSGELLGEWAYREALLEVASSSAVVA
jgi:hypothetical protein